MRKNLNIKFSMTAFGYLSIRIRAVFVILNLLIGISCSRAQNAADDFLKINRAYEKHVTLSMDLVYNYYPDHTTGKISETEAGHIDRDGAQIHYTLSDAETVQNDKYYTSVDHENKLIVVSERYKPSRTRLMEVNIDSMLSFCSKVEYAEAGGGQKKYTLSFSSYTYDEIEIVFDAESYLIGKLVLYYHDPVKTDEEDETGTAYAPRIEILYQNIKTEPVFEPNAFSETRFVYMENGQFKCKPDYKEYHVIFQKKIQ